VVDFVEICNICTRKVIIKAAKRIFNSDKICCSYCNFYFGVTFLEHTVYSEREREFTFAKNETTSSNYTLHNYVNKLTTKNNVLIVSVTVQSNSHILQE